MQRRGRLGRIRHQDLHPFRDGPGNALHGAWLGDDDGLLCVPYDDVEAVYQAASKKHEMETSTFKDIGKGDNNRAQYEKTLRELGCEFES